MTPDHLLGIPVRVNPNMPDGQIIVFTTCARCGHATCLHLGEFGCTECHDWPEDLRCKGDALEGGQSIVMVRDFDTLAAQQRERSEPQ